MSAQSDQAKGHAKEAAGLLTGNEDLQSEGRAEQVAGEAQEQTEKVKDTVEGGLDKVQHALNEVLDKAKKAVHRA
jgi:uncharacterized protein YjbJ (UPF0337 family)